MFKFYLLTQLSTFVGVSVTAGSLLVMAAFALMVIYFGEDLPNAPEAEKAAWLKNYHLKGIWWAAIVCFAIATFLPSTKQAAFIWLAPQLIENGAIRNTIKNIPELAELATDYMKETLKDKINDK